MPELPRVGEGGAGGGGGVMNCEEHEVPELGFRPAKPAQVVCTGPPLVCMG